MGEEELRDELSYLFDDDLEDEVVFDMWNSYAESHNKPVMYPMTEIQEVLMNKEGMSLLDILSSVNDKFYSDDEYFTIDELGWLVSFSDWYEVSCPFDRDELISSIVDTGNDYGSDAVRELLDRYEA